MPGSNRRLYVLLGLGALIYVVFHGLLFSMDWLGRVAVLDAKENLALARRIAEQGLAQEPFYRAMFYPVVLAWLGPQLSLVICLGLLCHLVSALTVGWIASRLWRSLESGCLAGLLYGVYPVALFFAPQGLDVTMSTTLFILAVALLLAGIDADKPVSKGGKRQIVYFALCGVFAGLSVLARPNFLPPVLIFPLLSLGGIWFFQRRLGQAGVAMLVTALPILFLLLAQGWLNHQLSGNFRILPWQGSYNLYAANHESANGKFYQQRVAFDVIPEGQNPTRMESEYFYQEATGAGAPLDVEAMGQHWRSQLIDSIVEDPVRWLGLMGRKVLYLFNDWEQYNNLTYAYHKARFPWLAWNPLGWGVLLIGAVVSVALGWRRLSKPAAAGLLLLALAYTAGLLLFFVSARFRLPLAPLLCIFWGGLAGLSLAQVRISGKRSFLLLAAVVGLAALSYGNWFDARDRKTFIQDEILLASAALRSGDDVSALAYANKSLARDSTRQEARRLQISALFNLWLQAESPSSEKLWQSLGNAVSRLENGDAATGFIRGVVYWRQAEPEKAREIWRDVVEQYPAEGGASAAALEWAAASPETKLSPRAQQVGTLLPRKEKE